ncbi:protease FtsH-inhibitory lysogeny factor CIII [Enterobacteriaceae bacterium H11S18]|nr:protease FtsH-inhibitory lysogeny factor CIII [Dryocola clanedunensis]MCT4710304.1 protease FtsH-inhibitory lysogeny factor CIII [Dryocola clanedunensis]
MMYAIAGSTIMDAAHLHESQLERITRQLRAGLRAGWKWLVDTLNQPGTP